MKQFIYSFSLSIFCVLHLNAQSIEFDKEIGEENARLDAGEKVNGGGKGFQLSGAELLDSEMESLC